MITLYTFGPYLGLPDGSPFVTKAMLLLKFAAFEFSEDRGGYRKAPKGEAALYREGLIVADSTFIRFHIEKKYDFDFDAGLHTGAKGRRLGNRKNVRRPSLSGSDGNALAR